MENEKGDELLLSRAWWTGGERPSANTRNPPSSSTRSGGRNSHDPSTTLTNSAA